MSALLPESKTSLRYLVDDYDMRQIRVAFGLGGFEEIGSGRHRVTFRNPYTSSVIKVPHSRAGEDANKNEYDMFVRLKDPRLARCSIEVFEGVKILHMEEVVDAAPCALSAGEFYRKNRQKFEPWCGECDGGQCGWTRDGRLVAWDYANHEYVFKRK